MGKFAYPLFNLHCLKIAHYIIVHRKGPAFKKEWLNLL